MSKDIVTCIELYTINRLLPLNLFLAWRYKLLYQTTLIGLIIINILLGHRGKNPRNKFFNNNPPLLLLKTEIRPSDDNLQDCNSKMTGRIGEKNGSRTQAAMSSHLSEREREREMWGRSIVIYWRENFVVANYICIGNLNTVVHLRWRFKICLRHQVFNFTLHTVYDLQFSCVELEYWTLSIQHVYPGYWMASRIFDGPD